MAFSLKGNFTADAKLSDVVRITYPGGIEAIEVPGEGWNVFHGPVLIGRCALRMDVSRVIARHRDKQPRGFGRRG